IYRARSGAAGVILVASRVAARRDDRPWIALPCELRGRLLRHRIEDAIDRVHERRIARRGCFPLEHEVGCGIETPFAVAIAPRASQRKIEPSRRQPRRIRTTTVEHRDDTRR